MDLHSFPRRKKFAAERRAQRHCSETCLLQRALRALNDVYAHRGESFTRIGQALHEALSILGPQDDAVPAFDFLHGALPFYKVRLLPKVEF